MMWLGSSWRSWMMYSPRSVSTGSMPCAFQVLVDGDLLADHRLALGDGARARRLADRQHRPRASSASAHQCTWPPDASTFASYASR
jgi:hypothetical protein